MWHVDEEALRVLLPPEALRLKGDVVRLTLPVKGLAVVEIPSKWRNIAEEFKRCLVVMC